MPKCRRCQTATTGRAQLCDTCRSSRPGTKKKATAKQAAPPAPPAEIPPGLHRRGAKLWEDLGCEVGTVAGELGLEICRMVDRLDEIDRIIAGKGVLQLMKFRLEEFELDDEGDTHLTVNVKFQSVLTEARGQQTTLKELIKEFRALQAVKPPAAGNPGTPGSGSPATPTAPAATGLDEVTQRRRAREQKTG